MNQYRCETCKHYDKDNFLWRCGYISKKFNVAITTGELDNEVFRYIQSYVGCASHSDFQSERDTHWRDLFVSDLRSLIKWDAEHGNPELFKAVVTLNKHYNTFSVEQHDKQVREKVLDELKSWCVQMKCNGCPYGGVLFGKITELRQAGEQ